MKKIIVITLLSLMLLQNNHLSAVQIGSSSTELPTEFTKANTYDDKTNIDYVYDKPVSTGNAREDCRLIDTKRTSSWSKPIVKNIGYHPQTTKWASNISSYTYTEGAGPKIKVDIGYGPFTYKAGNVGTAGKTITSNPNKQSRLYMRVYFNTATTNNYWKCGSVTKGRAYKVDHEAYYAAYR